jgi:chitin synthase
MQEREPLIPANHQPGYGSGIIEQKSPDLESPVITYTQVRSEKPVFMKPESVLGKLKSNLSMLIIITMYNEDSDELDKSLKGIARNVDFMCQERNDPTFNEQVAVLIVSDGRTRANPETLKYLEKLGLYSNDIVDKEDESIQVHLFENSVDIHSSEALNQFHKPLKVWFALKEKNAGKINSHWWAIAGFADCWNPTYVFVSRIDRLCICAEICMLSCWMWEHFQKRNRIILCSMR